MRLLLMLFAYIVSVICGICLIISSSSSAGKLLWTICIAGNIVFMFDTAVDIVIKRMKE
jgi:hypothetical protein